MATETSSDLTFAEIGEGERGALLEQIRAILAETSARGTAGFDEGWWRWQYEALPTGRAHVYAALEDGKVLAYYHVPVYRGVVRGADKTFAVVQGVAVSRKLRGRGVFRRLAEYATARLLDADIDLLYTFPNDKSIHTFVKYNGYEHVATYGAYALPVDGALLLGSRVNLFGLERVAGAALDKALDALGKKLAPSATLRLRDGIGEDVAEVFAAHQRPFGVHLRRDARYLRWRFLERPNSRHLVFALEKGGEAAAVAIFKLDEMFGIPALVLMDFACRPGQEADVLQILSAVRRRAREYAGEAVGVMFAAGVDPLLRRLPAIGFVPIPERLNPRPLHLLVKNAGAERLAAPFAPSAWRATLADWDVF